MQPWILDVLFISNVSIIIITIVIVIRNECRQCKNNEVKHNI